MPAFKYMVVCWTDGEDAGTYTTLSTSWIKNTDEVHIEDAETEDSMKDVDVLIEWRTKKKPTSASWPTYWATIKKLGDSRTSLEKYVAGLDKTSTPKLKSKRSPKPNRIYDDFVEEDSPPLESDKVPPRKSLQSDFQREMLQKYSLTKSDEKENKSCKKCKRLRQEKEELTNEVAKLRKMLVDELPEVLQQLKNMASSSSCIAPTDECQNPTTFQNTDASKPKQVELVPDSGVYIDALLWMRLQQIDKPTTFVRSLIVAIFDEDTLLKSNMRGGQDPKNKDGERKAALDPIKLEVMFQATLGKFPAVTRGTIGLAVNGKLAELRSASNKKSAAKTLPKVL